MSIFYIMKLIVRRVWAGPAQSRKAVPTGNLGASQGVKRQGREANSYRFVARLLVAGTRIPCHSLLMRLPRPTALRVRFVALRSRLAASARKPLPSASFTAALGYPSPRVAALLRICFTAIRCSCGILIAPCTASGTEVASLPFGAR